MDLSEVELQAKVLLNTKDVKRTGTGTGWSFATDGKSSVAVLKGHTIVWYGSQAPAGWTASKTSMRRKILHPNLTVVQLGDGTPPRLIDEIDLMGAQAGDWVAVFATGNASAGSAVFFDSVGPEKLKMHCLVAGLQPGGWEIWRDGYLEQTVVRAPAESWVLYFEEPAGNYYLKRAAV